MSERFRAPRRHLKVRADKLIIVDSSFELVWARATIPAHVIMSNSTRSFHESSYDISPCDSTQTSSITDQLRAVKDREVCMVDYRNCSVLQCMTCNTVLGDSLGICGEVQSLQSIICLSKWVWEYFWKHADSKLCRCGCSHEKGTKHVHDRSIWNFAEVTEDVRVNKKLEMSLKGHLAFS